MNSKLNGATSPLTTYGLSFSWKPGQKAAIDEVTLEFSRGELVALIGPNGSGKSTLLKLISGVLLPDTTHSSGLIQLQGQDLRSFSQASRARQIVYVPSDFRAEFPLSAQQAVSLGRTCHGSDQRPEFIEQAMKKAACWTLKDRDVRTLSGGEKQLVLLARALAQGARIMCLDESLSRMDLHHQATIGSLLKELTLEGFTIVLVAHDLNLAAEWASRCILLKSGKIVADGAIQSTLSEKNLSLLYPAAPLIIASSPGSGAPKVFFKGAPS